MPNIHKKISAARKLLGLSQEQAAELSNITYRTWQRLEEGHSSISLDYLERIAQAFHCRVDDIINFDLEANQFPTADIRLDHEIRSLKEENGRLHQFVNKLIDQIRGGGAK